MAAPTTADEALEQALLGPSQVQVKGTMVTARSAEDIIKLDQHIASKAAAANKRAGFGLRFSQIVPPGAG